jgi:hypothetical protein
LSRRKENREPGVSTRSLAAIFIFAIGSTDFIRRNQVIATGAGQEIAEAPLRDEFQDLKVAFTSITLSRLMHSISAPEVIFNAKTICDYC